MERILLPVVIVVLAIIGIAYVIGTGGIPFLGAGTPAGGTPGGGTPGGEVLSEYSTLALTVKDAALDTSQVEEVKLEIGEITIECDEGRITLSNETQTVNLMELQDEEQLLAEKNMTVGNCSQLRLNVISAMIKRVGMDWENLTLPSNVLRINERLRTRLRETTGVLLDFDLNRSLHTTGSGKVILAPVLHVSVREKVELLHIAAGLVRSEDGNVTADEEVGMDEDGNMGRGLAIGHNKTLEIGEDGKVIHGNGDGGG